MLILMFSLYVASTAHLSSPGSGIPHGSPSHFFFFPKRLFFFKVFPDPEQIALQGKKKKIKNKSLLHFSNLKMDKKTDNNKLVKKAASHNHNVTPNQSRLRYHPFQEGNNNLKMVETTGSKDKNYYRMDLQMLYSRYLNWQIHPWCPVVF